MTDLRLCELHSAAKNTCLQNVCGRFGVFCLCAVSQRFIQSLMSRGGEEETRPCANLAQMR